MCEVYGRDGGRGVGVRGGRGGVYAFAPSITLSSQCGHDPLPVARLLYPRDSRGSHVMPAAARLPQLAFYERAVSSSSSSSVECVRGCLRRLRVRAGYDKQAY